MTLLEEQYAAENVQKLSPVLNFEREDDAGNTEYKLHLGNQEKLVERTTQLNFRLLEGHGEAFYRIGIKDDGQAVGITMKQMIMSLYYLHQMCSNLNAKMLIREFAPGKRGLHCLIQVNQSQIFGVKLNIRLILLGDS